MAQQKRLRRGAGVLPGAIMDQKQVRRGLGHDPLQEGLVTPMGKPPPLAVRLEKALPFRR